MDIQAGYIKSYKQKSENKNEQTIISEVFSDYLSTSTIHGISYLGAKDKSLIEKTWWIISLILSVCACTYLINETWTKWKENPVIVSFAQEQSSVWEIPFPAVTVCPMIKVEASKLNYTEFYLSKVSKNIYTEKEDYFNVAENEKLFWDFAMICVTDEETFIYNFNADKITKEYIMENIKMVAPSLENTVWGTKWQSIYMYKHELSFVEQFTSEGLCFTFNALGHQDMYSEQMKEDIYIIEHYNESIASSTEWSIENGYTATEEESSYPLRTSQAGMVYGLSFNLWTNKSERTKYCGEAITGFKMMLHNPAEIPSPSENYFLVPTNQKVIVGVTPKVIRTSRNLINVPPHTRNCYFAQERKLRFYNIYTQYNCNTECLANITRLRCGCVPFYLPRDNNTEVCGYGNFWCVMKVKELESKYLNIARNNKIELEESFTEEYKVLKQCDCLTSCNYLSYKVEISQAEYMNDHEYSTKEEHKKRRFDTTPINIFFKESVFLALERNELYGQTDFIANIGGLLGLFMGFSFLSLLEIAYFLTLRVWCKIYDKNKTYIAHKPSTKIAWLN